MAATPEAKVKAQVKKLLTAYGFWHFSPFMGGMGRAGVPDIIACTPAGQFLAVECKSGDNQPTALQAREIERINAMGGTALVVRESNLDTFAEFIKCLAVP
jgi:Holliday junction resolvase